MTHKCSECRFGTVEYILKIYQLLIFLLWHILHTYNTYTFIITYLCFYYTLKKIILLDKFKMAPVFIASMWSSVYLCLCLLLYYFYTYLLIQNAAQYAVPVLIYEHQTLINIKNDMHCNKDMSGRGFSSTPPPSLTAIPEWLRRERYALAWRRRGKQGQRV